MFRLLPWLAILLIACRPERVPKPAVGDTVSSQEVRQILARGVNLSNWFNDYSDPSQYGTRFTAADMTRIKRAGFTYVRLPVASTLLFLENQPSELLSLVYYVDQAVALAQEAGLAVVLDPIHNSDETFEKRLATDAAFRIKVTNYWAAIATYFSKYPTNVLFFEVMNEPHVASTGKVALPESWWWPLQEQLLSSIRSVTTNHWVILGAESWNGRKALLKQTPYTAQNVIYNFHIYDPFLFTHQGADWTGWQAAIDARHVYYPSSPEAMDSLVKKASSQDLKEALAWYGSQHYGIDSVRSWIQPVAAWATRHDVVVMCNEFGSYKKYAPQNARINWARDMREVLEANGILWAIWEYDEGFGWLDYTGPGRLNPKPDIDYLSALGL